MNDTQYYNDKTMVSHSMLCDFVEYDEYGNRDIFPETFYLKHIAGVEEINDPTDAMMVGTIIDRYIVEGPDVLLEYPVVSRRNGDNPNEITKSMYENIIKQTQFINASPSFAKFAHDPLVRKQTVFDRVIDLPNGRLHLKGKTDFDCLEKNFIADGKTCGSLKEMFKGLQFRHKVNIRARYIRQLAYYMYVSGQEENPDFYGVLLVTDANGKIKAIKVRKDILDASWSIIKNDLIELREYYNNNFEDLMVDPFDELTEETDDDRL